MTRRRSPPPQRPEGTAFDDVLKAVDDQEAVVLAGIMEAVEPYDQGTVKGILYQKPTGGVGAYKWIDEIHPPFDLSALMAEMRDRYGPGDYEMRVFAGGKLRKNHIFSIARERATMTAPPTTNTSNGISEIMALIINQQGEARRDQAAAQALQLQMFQQASESQTKLLAAILPAMMGGRDHGTSAGDVVQLVAALQAGKGGGMKEMVETLAALKGLTENPAPAGDGGGGGFDPENLVETAGRLLGPASRALGDYLERSRRPPGDAAGSSASLPAGGLPPVGQLALGPAASPAPASRFPLLDLVRVDVTYGFTRGHDPEKIAELVYDVIEANNVQEAEINELASTFALSPDGLDQLAAEGIDLRSNPEWAREFFAALYAIHTEAGDDRGGEGGSDTNTSGNGEAREGREG